MAASRNDKPFYPIAALAIVLVLCFFAAISPAAASEWSDTKPQLNLSHIFAGEINRRGKPVGFHARINNEDPPFSRIKKIISGPNKLGVYTAMVEIFDRKTNQWKEKFSSFFPAGLSKKQIIALILKSYEKGKVAGQRKWRAKTTREFVVEGYTTARGGIITAYPIYTEIK